MAFVRIASEENLRKPELHLECDQVLLRPVVEIPLQASPLQVLCVHKPLSGRTQLVEPRLQVRAEPDVLEDQSGLMREVIDELLLDRCQRLAAAFVDAQRTEQLSLVAHLHERAAPSKCGSRPLLTGSP